MHRFRKHLLGWTLTVAACLVSAATEAAPEFAPEVSPAVQVAPGVYMVQGAAGAADSNNLGRIGNSGFIVGSRGIVAIDTGTSFRHGVALLAQIRRISPRPVVLALVTHTRQEFLFGASAFQEQGIPVHMHAQAADLMRSRCEHCLQILQNTLGADAMQGTVMFQPDHVFDEPHTITAAGRAIRVLYFGHSAGPGNVAVLDEASGVLFAGGLVDALRIPDVQDSELPAWSKALRALQALPVRIVVPGHGPAGTAAAVADVERYLAQLQAQVKTLLQAGTSLLDVGLQTALPDFARWDQYSTIHRRNASVIYLRLEREQMFSQRSGAACHGYSTPA